MRALSARLTERQLDSPSTDPARNLEQGEHREEARGDRDHIADGLYGEGITGQF